MYTPSQITSFYVEPNQYYETHVVSIDKSPKQLSALSKSAEKIIVQDTVFLMLCVKGIVNLYAFHDQDDKTHFYIQKNQSPIEELIVSYTVKEHEGTKALLVDKQYQRQLSVFLADCPSITNKIGRTLYTRASLQNLLLEYNQCKQERKDIFVSSEQKAKMKIGLLAGGSMTQLAFSGNASEDLTNASFNKATGYTAGLSAEFFLPRNRSQWSIVNELRWKAYSTNTYYKLVKSPNQYSDNTVSFNLGYATLVNAVRYYIPFKKVRPFLNAGISNAIAIKSENNKIVESHFYTTYRKEQLKAIEHFRKYEQGLVLGIGAEFYRLCGELRYELGNGMSEYSGLKSTTKTLNILLLYKLN